MLRLDQRVAGSKTVEGYLTLALAQRIKGRLRGQLDDGRDVGVFLPRGQVLRDGDLLRADTGQVIAIRAAPETVSIVHCSDPLLLARTCYHLGNRHVPLQIAGNQLAYQHDHVLDDMVRGLGLQVEVAQAPFDPEPGAYGNHGAGAGDTPEHAHPDDLGD